MKKVLAIIVNIFLIFIVIVGLLVAFSMLPIKGNYKLYTVMSGSMKPKISTGSIVVVKPSSTYIVGDIITYKNLGSSDKTTHRIYKITKQGEEYTFITKGDANDAPDTSPVNSGQIIGKEYFTVPLLGYVLNYIKTPVGLILIIIVPSVIIVYEELRKISLEAKEILKKRREKKIKAAPKKKKEGER